MRPKPHAEYERVYLLTTEDGVPPSGVANYRGKPHAFKSLYAEVPGWHSNLFILSPIGEETLSLALEDWELWGRHEDIYLALGFFPERKQHHEQIMFGLYHELTIDSQHAIQAEGFFRYLNHEHQVQWKQIR